MGQVRNTLPHVVSSPLVILLSFPFSDFVCLCVSLSSFLSARLLSHSCLPPPSVSLVWLPHIPFVPLACFCVLIADCHRLKGSQRRCSAAIALRLLIQLLRTKEASLSWPPHHVV